MSKNFSVAGLIAKKRDGRELTKDEIEFLIQGIVGPDGMQDSQLGAFLMAVYLKSMEPQETVHLTSAMVNSGDTLQLPSAWRGRLVDKHSTGGVGDKISLPLAPALAACGLKVPMISGRGLAYTGGTLDKLESIPGFNVSFSTADMETILEEVGCCIVGQTKSLVPADRIMYATRDVTGTVESLPLIASSIVSKKVAENLDALVLDVKTGQGAVRKTLDETRALAQCMVDICVGNGIKTNAVITQMDDPIGMAIGNSLEVIEAIKCLRGEGPDDVLELVSVLGGQLLCLIGKADNELSGAQTIVDVIRSGKAMEKFCAMLKGQGVDPNAADKLCNLNDVPTILTAAKFVTPLKSKEEGFIHAIQCLPLANVSCELGAGRQRAGEAVNHAVGLELALQVGSPVKKGEVWIRVHHDEPQLSSDHIEKLQEALVVKPEKCDAKSRIIEVVKGSKTQ